MICVKFTAFCDLRIRLATLRKSVRKFWFCKLALTCVDLRVRLASALILKVFKIHLAFSSIQLCRCKILLSLCGTGRLFY